MPANPNTPGCCHPASIAAKRDPTRCTGGGFYLTPDAKLDDGLLDMGIAQMLPRWRILGLLPKALFGKHTDDPTIEMATCRRLCITCHDPAPLHLDGEVVTQTAQSIEIQVEPGRLEIVV